MSPSACPIDPMSVEPHRNTRFRRPNRMVAFHGVWCFSFTTLSQRGKTRSRPMANELRDELTIAAWSEASVPPSTATIMTCFQKPPPIAWPT
jgi:hypothetical protein